jgi:hypothetical protein
MQLHAAVLPTYVRVRDRARVSDANTSRSGSLYRCRGCAWRHAYASAHACAAAVRPGPPREERVRTRINVNRARGHAAERAEKTIKLLNGTAQCVKHGQTRPATCNRLSRCEGLATAPQPRHRPAAAQPGNAPVAAFRRHWRPRWSWRPPRRRSRTQPAAPRAAAVPESDSVIMSSRARCSGARTASLSTCAFFSALVHHSRHAACRSARARLTGRPRGGGSNDLGRQGRNCGGSQR